MTDLALRVVFADDNHWCASRIRSEFPDVGVGCAPSTSRRDYAHEPLVRE